MAFDDLTLRVPVDSIDSVGLREVIDNEEITDVYAVLAEKDVRTPRRHGRASELLTTTAFGVTVSGARPLR